MKRKYLLTALTIMGIGFAAVSTTLYINGSTKINPNNTDFKVYYSDASVNGTQNLSVIKDDTHISFNTTLDNLGENYILDYDVTNGSKNYDADLEMTCTGGNEYLSVTNEFDDETILEALATRSGKLTLTQIKSNIGDDITVTIDCTIKANAKERDQLADDEEETIYDIGEEIYIDNELFYVIDESNDKVTLLAAYNVGTNNRQSQWENNKAFANTTGWEYSPAPKEIDIQQYDGATKTTLNNYVEFIKGELGTTDVTGTLITLQQLKSLGCTIKDEYTFRAGTESGGTCETSPYARWLVNNQYWWTRSANSQSGDAVWLVRSDGELYIFYYFDVNGVRPVITAPISVLQTYQGIIK